MFSILQKMETGLATFTWQAIGVSESINFKRLEVDNTTLIALLHAGRLNKNSGTYIQSGDEVTINTTHPHGFLVDSRVDLEILNGGLSGGVFRVTTRLSSTSFKVTHPSSGTASGDLYAYDTSGRVGIGVAAPQTLLHVGGLNKISGTYIQSGVEVTINTTDPHGFVVDSGVTLEILNGGLSGGVFRVTTRLSPTSFKVTHPSSGTASGDLIAYSIVFKNDYLTDISTGSYTDNLDQNGTIVLNEICSMPRLDGNLDYTGTIWVNNNNRYLRNCGASLAMGGYAATSRQSIFSRVSGVQSLESDQRNGDFTVETMFQSGSVNADFERYFEVINVFLSGHGYSLGQRVKLDFTATPGGTPPSSGVYEITSLTPNTFTVDSKPGEDGTVSGTVDVETFDARLYERLRVTSGGDVGMGTITPSAKFDNFRRDTITNGIDNQLFYRQIEVPITAESGASAETHLLGSSSLTTLLPDPRRFGEIGYITRFGPSTQNEIGGLCRGAGIASSKNPSTNLTYGYLALTCDGEIRYYDEGENFRPFDPSPGYNRGWASVPQGNITGGVLVKVDEDGIPIWATRQDGIDSHDFNGSVTVLNVNTDSPFIVVAGQFSGFTASEVSTVEMDLSDKEGNLSNEHKIRFRRQNSSEDSSEYYYVAIYDDDGNPVGSLGLRTLGTGGTQTALPTARSKPVVSALKTSDDGTYYFYLSVGLAATDSQIEIVRNSIDGEVVSADYVTYIPPIAAGVSASDRFLFLTKLSFQSDRPIPIELDWKTVINSPSFDEPGMRSYSHITTDVDDNAVFSGYYGGTGTLKFFEDSSLNPVFEMATGNQTGGLGTGNQTGGFISKYSPGGQFLWAVKQDGVNHEVTYSIATDRFGNVFSTGTLSNTLNNRVFPTDLTTVTENSIYLYEFDSSTKSLALAYTLTRNVKGLNAYLCKYDSGGKFQWITTIEDDSSTDTSGLYSEYSEFPFGLTVDLNDNVLVSVACSSEFIVIYNQDNSRTAGVYPFKELRFPNERGTLLVRYDGNGRCLNYFKGVAGDTRTLQIPRTLQIESLHTSSGGQIMISGTTNSFRYYFYSPDGSVFRSVLNRGDFVTGDSEENFFVNIPYQPTYILRNPRDPMLTFRIKLLNPGEIPCYVTFLDLEIDQTYDYVSVPANGSVELEFQGGKWTSITNRIRGPIFVDDRVFSVQIGSTEPTDSNFEVVGSMIVNGETETFQTLSCKNIFVTSDERFKRNIEPLTLSNPLDQIDVVEYKLKYLPEPQNCKIGVIAQDVEEVYKNIVYERAFDDMSVKSVQMEQLFTLNVAQTKQMAVALGSLEEDYRENLELMNRIRNRVQKR